MSPNFIWKRLERRFVFFPSPVVEYTPGDVGLAYEDAYFDTDDGHRLHRWYIPGTTDSTWLWFHSNGGNVGHRLIELALLRQRFGVNLLIFDYRGYGKSEGRPSEMGTYQDARAALRYLRERADLSSGPIVYFGHSLGSAIAVELALEHPPGGLVLVSPFTAIKDMARLAYPWLPVGLLVGNSYDTRARIPNVRCPLLILHGVEDELVPITQAEGLFEAAQEPKSFQALFGTGHNDTFEASGEVFWSALAEFLSRL